MWLENKNGEKMSNIKVSVICLVYNHEPYLRKCLDGFVNQKCNFEYEVLIHDDASTDNSASIIREYEEKYPNIIKPIYQTENQMSKGVKISSVYLYPKAQGEYLAWCEGDDYWTDENKLQRQVDFLDSHPEYIACVHKFDTINKRNEKTNEISFGYYEKEGAFTLDDFQNYDLPSHLATLCSRNIIKNNTRYQALSQIKLQGDIKIFLFLLLEGNIYRMCDNYSVYRIVREEGGESWTSRRLSKKDRCRREWNGIRSLEKTVKEVYGIKINCKKRKQQIAFYDIILDRKLFTMIKKAFYYIFNQSGMIPVLVSKVFNRKRKILDNKL